jgi:hypothetical protein
VGPAWYRCAAAAGTGSLGLLSPAFRALLNVWILSMCVSLQPKPALDQGAAALQAAAWASGPSEPAAGDGEAAADKDDVWANASKADLKRVQQVRGLGG